MKYISLPKVVTLFSSCFFSSFSPFPLHHLWKALTGIFTRPTAIPLIVASITSNHLYSVDLGAAEGHMHVQTKGGGDVGGRANGVTGRMRLTQRGDTLIELETLLDHQGPSYASM